MFFIAGYNPEGARFYYKLFRRDLAHFLKLWPVKTALSRLQRDEDGVSARWQIKAEAPNWRVETSVEYLGWDDIVSRDMQRPMTVLVPRVLHCLVENLLNGTTFRVFRGSWKFGLFYLCATMVLLLSFAGAILIGLATYLLTRHAVGVGGVLSIGVSIVVGGICCALAHSFCERNYLTRLCNSSLWHRDWARGRRADFLARVDEFAHRIIAKARAGDVDEVLVVGQSSGGAVAIAMFERALDLDSKFACAGSPVVLASLGSSLPLVALNPHARDVRRAIRRVAVEPSLTWIECEAREDVLSFEDFDMVGDVGVDAGPQQCNPLCWNLRFRDAVSPQHYRARRWDFVGMHHQYIMANDQVAPYDYYLMVCGPLRARDWVTDAPATVTRFARDASYVPRVSDTSAR